MGLQLIVTAWVVIYKLLHMAHVPVCMYVHCIYIYIYILIGTSVSHTVHMQICCGCTLTVCMSVLHKSLLMDISLFSSSLL